jgi:type I restriction-modification system DNA methylase subunit
MARKTSSKPHSGSAQSSTLIGYDLSAVKDIMVALPGGLFDCTRIPVYLWFLAKNKNADAKRGFRDRRQLIEPAT